MSLPVKLAAAVTERLKSHYPDIAVERAYNPKIELEKPGELKIVVVPSELARKQVSRNMIQLDVAIDLVVLKKLTSQDIAEIDEVMEFTETLARDWDGMVFDSCGGAKCNKIEHNPIYVERWIAQNRQFASRIVLRFVAFERGEGC